MTPHAPAPDTARPPYPDDAAAAPSLDWLARRAAWLVAGAVALHALAWTLLPTRTNASLPLDVIEALAWGREWRMGYDKHPPLSAWAAELAAIVGRRNDAALYALSQVCVAIAAFASWRLARDLLDDGRAALATLALLVGVTYMHFTSPEFNVNVLQLPLWGLLFLSVWRGAGARGAASIAWWLGAGAAFGLAMLTKYLAAFAAPPLAVFMLATPTGRRALRSPGPWIGAIVAGAIFFPHARWMVETDFVTLTYGMRRASSGDTALLDHVVHPLKFIAAQAFACVFALVPILAAGARRRTKAHEGDAALPPPDARGYLWLVAVGPVLAMAAYALVTGARLRSMWGTPMLLMTPALLTMLAAFPAAPRRAPRLAVAWSILFVLALGAYAADNAVAPAFTKDAKRTNFPGRDLAASVENAWSAREHSPLPIVIGDEWYGGLVSWCGGSRASVYIDGSTDRTFWLNDDDVRARGAMVVWKLADTSSPDAADRSFVEGLQERFPELEELGTVTLPARLRLFGVREISEAGEILGRAYIPAPKGP